MATPPVFLDGEILYASSMNKVGLWQVAGGLVTSGSSFDINNCFTTDYDSYKIVLSNIRVAAGTPSVQIRLMNGATPISSNVYFYGITRVDIGAGTINVVAGNGLTLWDVGAVGGTTSTMASFEIHGPNNIQQKSFNGQATDSRGAASYQGISVAGTCTSTASCTGLRVLTAASTFTNCRYNIYGYRYSS
jgi:hypothetical protein